MANTESPKQPIDTAEVETPPASSTKVIDSTTPGELAALPPASNPTEPWRQYWDLFVLYLSRLPDFLGEFFGQYQRPLTIVALILSAGITVYVTGAVVDAINDIPLLAPFFELVGIGYSVWFVYRYLRLASTREELSGKIQSLKEDVVGRTQAR